MLGEDVVALAAAGEVGEQQFVVVHADADGRGRDGVVAGCGCDFGQAGGVGLALVGVAVGEEQERGPAVLRDTPCLLQPTQQTAGEVRHPAGLGGRDRVSCRRLVMERAGRHDDEHLVIERHDAEVVGGREAIDELDERQLRSLEPLTIHRPAAVEHDLHGGRRPRCVGLWRRSNELEHHGYLVVLLDGDNVDVDVGVHLHADLLDFTVGSESRAPVVF